MKKKFLSVLLIVAVLIGMAGVSGTQTESGEQKADKEQKQQENEQTAETKVEIPPEAINFIPLDSSTFSPLDCARDDMLEVALNCSNILAYKSKLGPSSIPSLAISVQITY